MKSKSIVPKKNSATKNENETFFLNKTERNKRNKEKQKEKKTKSIAKSYELRNR